MKTNTKFLVLVLMVGMSLFGFSQDLTKIKLDAVKVKKYEPFVAVRHGGAQDFATWKANNKVEYTKQMWYYSESFYVKRNVNSAGVTLDESIIDITRFDSQRKATEETIVNLPGYKDVIVLIPANNLIYNHTH